MTEALSDGGAPATRRAFLTRGSVAAAGATLALYSTAAAAEPPSADDSPGEDSPAGPALNVRDCGAVGDGQTDDTRALQAAVARAKAAGVGMVFIPAGTFLLSDALRLPSQLRLCGAGTGLTILRAVAGTQFPLVRPDPRTQEVRQRRTMITTETAGSVRDTVVQDAGLARLTVDWNHCPTGGYGSSCVLIDSADGVRLEQVRFLRCLPADHPRRLEDMGGSGFRCECVMVSNSRHVLLDGCQLTDSGYRPLSVAYGSLDVTFQNGRIVASNPVWRHAFAEVHGDGIPRDERYVRSHVKFLNSTFVLEGGTAQDGICSHTGTVYIENCDFFIRGGTRHLGYVVKPFDGSRRCQCLNNRFHCQGDYEERFSIIGSIGDRTNEEMLFAGNIIDVAWGAETGDRAGPRGLVDFSRSEVRCRVQDNQFLVHCAAPRELPVIRLIHAQGFTVSGNLIEFRGEAGESGPTGIAVESCAAGTVTANVVSGKYRVGIRLSGELRGVVVAGNSLTAAVGSGIQDDSQGDSFVQGNLF